MIQIVIMNISDKDIKGLSKQIIDILKDHEVEAEWQYSITSDVMFSFSNLIDEKTGTDFHERIFTLLDELFEPDSDAVTNDTSTDEMQNLYDAIVALNKEKVQKILNRGFDKTMCDITGDSLLHKVILNEENTQVIRYVVELGFDLNSKNNSNWTPLYLLRKYLVPNEANKSLHKWLSAKGAVSVPDTLGEKWV